ncbi:MAG: hypothetical protein UHW97_06575 [Frisingicoccus sp.]|nr:hypothetical protein [Frisingicoccus sp.]
MAFFDDLKAGLSEVAKTVGEKSEQFVGISKLHLKKTNLTNELKATYIELGKMVYEEKKAGAEFSEPITKVCQKIEMGLEAIQEVETQIEEAKAAGREDTTVEATVVEDDEKESEMIHVVEEAAEAVETMAEEVTEAVEEIAEETSEAAEEIVEKASEAAEDIAEDIKEEN